MAKLLVQESTGVREFEIVDAEVGIGRELDNAVRVSDPSISRHHCVVRKVGEGYEIQDLQSSNGVLVNGVRVQGSPLKDGDRVTLGQLQITFQDPASALATVAIQAGEPASPLGTVRMNSADMAKIQGLGKPASEAPIPVATPAPQPMPVPAIPPPAGSAIPSAPSASSNPAPAFLQKYLPPVPDDAKPTGERGDFVTRLLACLIDGAIPMVLFIALIIVNVILAFIPFLGCIATCLIWVVVPLFMLGYSFFFMPWCLVHFGATPGKKIMKLRVVPEDDPTGRIDFGTAILRMVGHMLNFGFGYLLILGEERKAVQDIISKSIVIKVDR